MRRRVSKIAGFCVLLTVTCLPGYIATRQGPADSIDDADLSVVHQSVSPPEDGLTHLLAAVRHSQMNDADWLLAEAVWNGNDVVASDIAAVLDANEQALTHLRKALAAPHFRLPELAADEFDVVPEIPLETESLVTLLRLQSMYNAGQGEWDTAFDNALDILRLAQRIEGANHAALTTTMLSVGYRSVGLETLRRLTSLAPLANEQARRWGETLPSYRSDASAWKRMWAVEYQQWKSLLGWIEERAENDFRNGNVAEVPSEFSERDIAQLKTETKRTLEVFANMTRTYQRASELDCASLAELPFPENARYESGGSTGEPGENMSDISIALDAPDYRDFFVRRCAEDTALAATQTLIALRAFHQDLGHLPEALTDLVPDYLDAIPTDSFGGKPIHYSRAHKLVYSLGAKGAMDPGFEVVDDTAAVRELSYPIEF